MITLYVLHYFVVVQPILSTSYLEDIGKLPKYKTVIEKAWHKVRGQKHEVLLCMHLVEEDGTSFSSLTKLKRGMHQHSTESSSIRVLTRIIFLGDN